MARLTPEQWQSIRTSWEYDPDEPSLVVAATRAAKKYDFQAPRKQSIHGRAKAERWARRSSMNGLSVAAHRRADALMNAAGVPAPDGLPDGKSTPNPDAVRDTPPSASAAMTARDSDLEKRAAINVRHRQEWQNIAILRNEALSLRLTDPVRCSERMRQVKTASEITAMQQAGERKAWSLDIVLGIEDLKTLSDEALEAIASGRLPKGI